MIAWFIHLDKGTQTFLFVLPFVTGAVIGILYFLKMHKRWGI